MGNAEYMGLIKMKIVTFTLFAIIATILASLRRSKRSKNKDKATLVAECKKMCYGSEPSNYWIEVQNKAQCVCRKGGKIVNFFGWDQGAKKFVPSKRTTAQVEYYLSSGLMKPMPK